MSLCGNLNTLMVIPYSYTPYSDQTNKLSKPMVPIRQIGPPTRQLTAEFDPKPTSLRLGGRKGLVLGVPVSLQLGGRRGLALGY